MKGYKQKITTKTVLQFRLKAPLCFLFTNCEHEIKMIGMLLNVVHLQVHKKKTYNKGV